MYLFCEHTKDSNGIDKNGTEVFASFEIFHMFFYSQRHSRLMLCVVKTRALQFLGPPMAFSLKIERLCLL